jgi:sugar diacid utilization regulator
VSMTQPRETALRTLALRVAARKESISQRLIDRFREEIVGWQGVDDAVLAFQRAFVELNLDALVCGIEFEEALPDELLDAARELGARRVHQGVSFEAMLHEGRVAGETFWDAVLGAARIDQPEEREAALQIAGRLWRHVDVVSTAAAHAYIDEMTDRGLLGRDLLDALLSGHGDGEQIGRLARMLQRRLGENHVVVLIRADGAPVDDGQRMTPAIRMALDKIVEAARTHLRPSVGSLLIGIRQGDVVALYPLAEPEHVEAVKREAAALSDALAIDVSIGMSGWHHGRAAIAIAFAEAREAVEIAAGTGIRGRAVALEDVLVDHMLRASAHARAILRQTLQPLLDYDRGHRSELVTTLRAYLQAGTNLTRSASLLMVHPNTVVYRLRRIRQLSGRDPHDMEDLQVLFLALKLSELSSAPPGG